MLKDVFVDIPNIYVPLKRRDTLNQETVDALAENILEEGMKVPIQLREDGGRFVLVAGLHRLEACRALGDEKITCIIVDARKS
ncbi:MAG: ParB N-terminal domain-containing protein [Proteobacteria bacterium]|nr:ParB N-terminal domain-containing protein [Pseudomonadota bacterium]MDA1355661.1 ParB N-terminal domain-containing protein [Pseudomonadota bacterium]